ncbi:MAG: hypothetical protein DRJ26_00680 [Candidatus Methanomethylicota archaeon]|uniref:Aminopeptidase P family protein n=1 Tax=Thermoproteota archaeon TaxID=2056631 RepID=A0A497F7K4_9CREN|nr:MAG: hypothetical protein DRJ20_01035 [Candidatus Verstraetearchaeota archaeon]RLE55575.1 MAG: hypothetical protein DRJ26_00680 [Candidatus Verstraetearchaeota archaeon]
MEKPSRIERLASAIEDNGIDVAIFFSRENLCYLTGNLIDYAASLLTSNGEVVTVCSFLEYERAKAETWSDEVVAYLPYDISNPPPQTVKSRSLLDAVCKVVSDLGFSSSTIGFEADYLSRSLSEKLFKGLPEAEFKDVSTLVSEFRQVKDSSEVENIRRATRILSRAFRSAADAIEVGVSEVEVAGEALRAMIASGGSGIFKMPIVASGYRSALPHGRASSKAIERGELVVLDFVVAYNWYYGDLTRVAVVGYPSSKQLRLYEVVVEALEAAISSIKPGVTCAEVDRVARKIIAKAGFGEYFIHSTGHGIGLSVHERPRLSSTDSTVLKPGMVVTVEPGIYIPDLGGVRVERDVLVTEDGAEVLDNYPIDLMVT